MRAIFIALCCALFLAFTEAQFPRRQQRLRPGRRFPRPPQPTGQSDRDILIQQSAQKKNERKQTQQQQNERKIAQQAGQPNPTLFRRASSSPLPGLFTQGVLFNGVTYPIIDGKVTLPDGQVYLICGNLVGLASENICCNGFLYSLLTGATECCGDVFIYSDEICCEGNIFPQFFRNLQIGCCGEMPIFAQTEVCCGGVITSGTSCGGVTCPTGFVCCGGIQVQSSTGLGCCNNEFYSTGFQLCCNEQQIKLTSEGCSTTGCVETATQFCCEGGNSFLKGFGIDCCNDNIFSPQFQQCCSSGEVKLIGESCSGCTPVAGSTFCCGEESVPINSGIGCCGGVPFGLTGGATCCGGTVISSVVSCCIGNVVTPIAQCP